MSRNHNIGDRYDAKLVRNVPALEKAMIHLMPKRTECEVCLHDKLDVTELLKYIEHKNAKNDTEHQLSLFSCVVTALAMMLCKRPRANRFVQGRRLYQRSEISIGFICKTSKSDDAKDLLAKYTALSGDNVDSISHKLFKTISSIKNSGDSGDNADNTVNFLAKLPNCIVCLIFGFLKILDYFGADISSLTEGDCNYCSIVISNLGSIGMNSVYHHLNNYGTNSMVVTLGILHREEIVTNDGSRELRDIVDIQTTVDERVAPGFYFAGCIATLKEFIANPELLERALVI